MKKMWIVWVAGVLLAGHGRADILSVSNGNASIAVDPGSVFGLSSYAVDNTEEMFEEWFWYRLPGDSYEHSLDNLPLISASATGNEIQLSFANTILGVGVDYQLTGGAPGSGTASLLEHVVLTNLTAAPLPLAWFSETDFDLGGFGGADSAWGGVNGIVQTDGMTVADTTSTLTPDAFQIAPFPDLFLSLEDLSISNLDNSGSPFGPGDATFAFQWNLDIGAGSSISYDISKDIYPTPEPGTGTLLCLALLGLAKRLLRNRGSITAVFH
jgi:hypothetical protein